MLDYLNLTSPGTAALGALLRGAAGEATRTAIATAIAVTVGASVASGVGASLALVGVAAAGGSGVGFAAAAPVLLRAQRIAMYARLGSDATDAGTSSAGDPTSWMSGSFVSFYITRSTPSPPPQMLLCVESIRLSFITRNKSTYTPTRDKEMAMEALFASVTGVTADKVNVSISDDDIDVLFEASNEAQANAIVAVTTALAANATTAGAFLAMANATSYITASPTPSNSYINVPLCSELSRGVHRHLSKGKAESSGGGGNTDGSGAGGAGTGLVRRNDELGENSTAAMEGPAKAQAAINDSLLATLKGRMVSGVLCISVAFVLQYFALLFWLLRANRAFYAREKEDSVNALKKFRLSQRMPLLRVRSSTRRLLGRRLLGRRRTSVRGSEAKVAEPVGPDNGLVTATQLSSLSTSLCLASPLPDPQLQDRLMHSLWVFSQAPEHLEEHERHAAQLIQRQWRNQRREHTLQCLVVDVATKDSSTTRDGTCGDGQHSRASCSGAGHWSPSTDAAGAGAAGTELCTLSAPQAEPTVKQPAFRGVPAAVLWPNPQAPIFMIYGGAVLEGSASILGAFAGGYDIQAVRSGHLDTTPPHAQPSTLPSGYHLVPARSYPYQHGTCTVSSPVCPSRFWQLLLRSSF